MIEANDAARRQTANRRDARSVAAAETKLQGNAADNHEANQSPKTAGVKVERNRQYDALFVASKVTSNGTSPKDSRARREKAFMARVTARSLSCSSSSRSSSNPQAVPLSLPGAKPPRRPLRPPRLRLELVGTRPPKNRWLREPNLLRLQRLRRRMATM